MIGVDPAGETIVIVEDEAGRLLEPRPKTPDFSALARTTWNPGTFAFPHIDGKRVARAFADFSQAVGRLRTSLDALSLRAFRRTIEGMPPVVSPVGLTRAEYVRAQACRSALMRSRRRARRHGSAVTGGKAAAMSRLLGQRPENELAVYEPKPRP